ncbi:MAG: Glutathionylspermidine synthase preATP-grasp [Sporanaerobacter sp.]|jgi:glutathionylspermidine synthase|uniref:circularly permuted type 2 ATP-grasp protein n=1 Tax=Sporanaerobacter sp. TaxID=2010183 RepID=UPI003A103428
MDMKKLTDEYIDIIKRDVDKYYDDYEKAIEAVANSTAIYKGEPVPFLYEPIFYTQSDVERFNEIGRILISITNKVTQKYIESPEYRKKFGYSKLLEELILVDQGYDINVPIGRFDIFYGGNDDFKFCEFNTDGSSAMNEDNTLARILLQSKAIKKMREKYDIEYFELIYKWVDESIDIFKKYNKAISRPNVAIVDFKESGTPYEFEEFKKAYIKRGYRAEIVDPRELKYIDGKLYYEDMNIDMIYRRIVTREFIEKSSEISDLIEAYRDGAVCMIGSMKSQIMHNKIIFKILYDEDTLEFLADEERNFIKKHIPYTEEFKGSRSVYEKVLNHKDEYILKPKDSYGSKGVYAGKDFTYEDWSKKLDEVFGKDYLFQEFFEPYKTKFVVFEDGELKIKEFGTITGLFLYNEKFVGLYTRVGENSIISGLHGYYTVPNLLVI